MGATARKDYGSDAIIADNNETLKRVNTMNTPYSVQASGVDKIDGRLQVIDSTTADSITARQRVLWGNKEGYIKSVTLGADPFPLVSCVIAYLDKEKVEVTQTFTKAQLIAEHSLFIINENF